MVQSLLMASLLAAFMAEPDFLGFSGSGSHAALAEAFVQDGSGAPGAALTVISTGDGETALRLELTWTEWMMYEAPPPAEDGDNPALDSVMELAAPTMGELGFDGAVSGTRCIHHPMTDVGSPDHEAVFVPWMYHPGYSGPEMQLRVSERPYGGEVPEWLSMFGRPVLLDLSVTGERGDVLLRVREDTLPPGPYPLGYRIRDVYVLGDSVAAFVLAVETPGFEGRDVRYRLVAGRI